MHVQQQHPLTSTGSLNPMLMRILRAMALTAAVIFWGSAAIGLWAAHDKSAAWGRFMLLSVGLLLIWIVGRSTYHGRDNSRVRRAKLLQLYRAVGIDCGLLAGGIGLLFVISHDWQLATTTDFTLFPALTGWLQGWQFLGDDRLLLHENLVAGALIVLLPIAGMTLWQVWWDISRVSRYCALSGVMIGGVALLLTFSRGGWLGLGGGILIAAYLHWRTGDKRRLVQRVQQQHSPRSRRHAQSFGHYPTTSGRRRVRRGLLRGSGRGFMRWLTSGLDRLLDRPALLDWGLGVTLFCAIAILVGVTLSSTLHERLMQPLADTYLAMTVEGRLTVWRDVLPVIQDYLFTGSGLGSTPMVLASYLYLLHVPYLNHAHSLYLQVAVEQGLPGLIGLLALLASTITMGVLWLQVGRTTERHLTAGALAAQVAILIYGCTDAELYVGLFAPLLLLPTALLIGTVPWRHGQPKQIERHWATSDRGESAGRKQSAQSTADAVPMGSWAAGWEATSLGILLPTLAVLTLLVLPGSHSRWMVNRAAVAQTKAELTLYQWPDWPIQDAVRRSENLDAAQWITLYERVAQTEQSAAAPRAVAAARRRLGQILLSQGDYERAEQLLTAAYQTAPEERATRQLLGESKALLGKQAEARALWQTVEMDQGQLALRTWWYEHIGDSFQALHFAGVANREPPSH